MFNHQLIDRSGIVTIVVDVMRQTVAALQPFAAAETSVVDTGQVLSFEGEEGGEKSPPLLDTKVEPEGLQALLLAGVAPPPFLVAVIKVGVLLAVATSFWGAF
jgi:hypothetical protein